MMKDSLFSKAVSVACSFTLAFSLLGMEVAYAGDDALVSAEVAATDVAEAPVWDGTADTSWYNATSTTFTLSTPQQVAGLALITSGAASGIATDTFAGKTVVLGADLALNTAEQVSADSGSSANLWKPIGDINTADGNGSVNAVYFDGTFDGAGHVVRNLYIDGSRTAAGNYGGYQGFFGSLGPHARVLNLGIESGQIYGRVAGGIAAVSHVADADEVPQVVGCFNKASIRGNGSSSRGVGGIFGGEDASGSMSGGSSSDAYRAAALIADCYNFGNIAATGPSGGIAGVGSVKVYACYNDGFVSGDRTSYVGALVGNLFAKGYTSGSFSAAGEVANSYALEGSCTNLYRIIDATHSIDDPAYPSSRFGDEYYNETADFIGAEEFETYGAEYLGTAYVSDDASAPANNRLPLLWWQKGLSTIDLAAGTIGPVSTQLYAGGAITPPLHVYIDDPNGGYEAIELNAGSDYYAVYENNVGLGTARVTVYGRGRYTGQTATTTFDIVQADISDLEIDPIPAQWLYDKPVTPTVTVRANGEYELIEGYDYRVSYVNNDKAGQAKVVIMPLRSSVLGQREVSFYIVEAAASLEGKGTEAQPYLIGSKGELQFAAHMVDTDTGSYPTAHYKLTRDVDASSSDPDYVTDMGIDPIGVPRSGFAGTFDGDGHTITLGMDGTKLSEDVDFDPYLQSLGLFALTNSYDTTTIKNLTIDGSISNYASVGGFVGSAVDDTLVFENCSNRADVTTTGPMMAAAGYVVLVTSGTSIQVKDCENHGTISASWEAGGFVNRLHGARNSFYGCGNYGSVTASNSAGGIVGEYRPSSSSTLSFENCYNRAEAGKDGSGKVTSSRADGGPAGGILGFVQFGDAANKAMSFVSCYNAGAVSGGRHGGGIAGQIYTTPATFSGCYNAGAVTSKSPYVGGGGGIVGAVAYKSDGWAIDSCYNVGAVSGGTGGGAMVGHVYTGSVVTLKNCFYLDSCGSGADGMGEVVAAQGAQTPSVVTGAAVSKTEAQMKGADVLSALGSSFVADRAGEPLNGGFPTCYWQRAYAKVGLGSAAVVVKAIPDQPYASGPVEPAVEVVYKDPETNESATLRLGVDYKAAYENNVALSSSDSPATVTLSGVGRFEGTRAVTFNIVKAAMGTCSIADIAAQWCTDVGAQPAPVVTNAAGRVIAEGTDYEVAYADNEDTGTATLTVTGMGGYDGSITKQFRVVKASDGLSGAGTKAEPYEVKSAGDLHFMQSKVAAAAGDYQFAYYKLANDISIVPSATTPAVSPIGSKSVRFSGVFDGGGHTVTLGIETDAQQQALFGVTERAQVRNLKVAGSVNQEVPLEAGDTSVPGWAAAFVAYAYDSLVIEDCVNEADVTTNAAAVAGFVAAVDALGDTVTLKNCVNEGDVASTNESYGTVVGGLVGDVRAETLVVKGCANAGALRGTSSVGGLVARAAGKASDARMALSVSQSRNAGAVTGFHAAGGLVGSTQPYVDLTIANSFNRGAVASNLAPGMSAYLPSTTAAIGGLVGGTGSDNRVVVRNAYNAGTVTSSDSGLGCGGLVGYLSGDTVSAKITGAYYLDSVIDSVAIQNAAGVTADASEGRAADELKSAATVADLGSAFGPDSFGVNGGYPILGGQKASLPELCSVSPAPDMAYTGRALKPRFVVFDRAHLKVLSEGRDYEVVCEDNVNVGTATAHIVGAGAYQGEIDTTFDIVAADLSDFSADDIPLQPFEGEPVEPAVTVRDLAGAALVAGRDFTVSYRGNDAEGTAYAIVRGKGNYTGFLRVPFEVVIQTSLEGAAKVSAIGAQQWTGEAIEPAVTVMLDGVPMLRGTEYEMTYADNVEIGAATVTVTGIGKYKGTLTATFSIVAADLSAAKMAGVGATTFTGKAITPTPAVTLGGRTLVAGTDFTYSYANNVNAGTATVTATGKGHYAGTKSVNFTIRPAKANVVIGSSVASTVTKSVAATAAGVAASAAAPAPAKAANPITFSSQSKTVSWTKLKKARQTVTLSKAKRAKGAVTYSIAKASKKRASFKIASKTGKVTVKKGTSAGVYRLTVKASAAGNASYAPGSAMKTVTVRVKK